MIAALVVPGDPSLRASEFDIRHVSGWRSMASLPPVYRVELLASSISMFTTIWLKEPCIFHALVKITNSS